MSADYLNNIGSWFLASFPAGAITNGIGLTSLAGLFAFDRVLTRGQHLRRVADVTLGYRDEINELKSAHLRELAENRSHWDDLATVKDAAYAELKQSRDIWHAAANTERDRGDKVTAQLSQTTALITGAYAKPEVKG
jgi:hypothetical protein